MTVHKNVTDGDILSSKLADLTRRCAEGTLPTEYIAKAIQEMIEGDFVIGGLLKFVGSLHLKAVKRFVVADNFKVGNVVGERKIGLIGGNFQAHFGEVVEENVPPKTVHVWQLNKNSLDGAIIKLFGGEESPKTQTSLAHQFQMMELGEGGKCRLDGCANFGYKLSSVDGRLWVPGWSVGGGGFRVGACSPSNRDGWGGGNRVCGG